MKSPTITMEEWLADVDRVKSLPKKSKMIYTRLTDEQREMIIEARKRGLSFEKIRELTEKHFNFTASLWVFRDFFTENK